MKQIIILFSLLAFSFQCSAQTEYQKTFGCPEKNPKWDSTKESLCGLGQYCCYWDGTHYYSKSKPVDLSDPSGYPCYGPEGALVGVINRFGIFFPTKRRDHLAGHIGDRILLEDPERLTAYIKSTYHL